MASVGNPQSFWATEASFVQMFGDAGFETTAIVDPIYQSKYGARRYFLLNCEKFVPNPAVVANIARSVERAEFSELVKQGRFEDARALLEGLPALSGDADNSTFRIALTRMRMHFGEPEKAIQEIKVLRDRALLSGDRWSGPLLRCADFFELAGDPLEAEKTRAAVYDSIRDPAQLKALLRQSAIAGTESLKRNLLTLVEERFSSDVDLLGLSLNAYYALEDFAAAERVCRLALAVEPENAKLHARLGHLTLRRGDKPGAAASYERALAFDRGNPEILERLTSIYLRLKNKNRAENFARKLIRVAPLNPKAHYYLAQALRGRNRKAEELEHAARAAELDPGNERYREFVKALSQRSTEVRAEPK